MDRLTVLRHSRCVLTKTWCADGTIKPYDDGKFFTLSTVEVRNLVEASAVLQLQERQPKACVIRGRYVGDEEAARRDPEHQQGKVRRTLDVFEDQPLHLVMVDVDQYEPLLADPVLDPAAAIDEYIQAKLPEPFHGAGFHWHLSSSAGHASKLKAHVWFWLATPLTSAQLKAWAKTSALELDAAVFNPVQVHYTADPLFEPGVEDPCPERSGLVRGVLGDEVVLDLDLEALSASGSAAGRYTRMAESTGADPIVQRMAELGLLKEQRRDGSYNIVCPFESEHTTAGGASSTTYFPPHTGGHAVGNFKCLHAHCESRPRGVFLAKLGLDDPGGDFEPVRTEAPAAPTRKGIPEARHLVTDQANAGRIVERFGKQVMVAAGRWYSWDGRRWVADDADVYRYACNLSKIIHVEADQWAAKTAHSDEERKARDNVVEGLRAWAKRSEMKATIEAAVQLVRKMLSIDEGLLDRDPYALNCLNGTVDLRTGQLRSHDPEGYITKLAPVGYDPAAQATVFETVIAQIMMEEGRTTKPLVGFLQRLFGYCATGSTREQIFAVHHGQGSNGKSTLLDSIAAVLGDYAATAAPGLMVSSGKDRHPTEVADLFGRRLVVAHESSEGNVLREDFVKQATGGDRIKARYMRADFFEFSPTHKLHLLTNHRPIIRGQDHGIWRRVLLVPYWARFGSAEEVAAARAQFLKDAQVADRLAAEMPGILAWVVQGAVTWFTEGLQPPDAVLAASKDYQTEQDRVGQFINETCELGREFSEPLTLGLGGLYPAYVSWCKESGFMPLARNRLLAELERRVPFFANTKKHEAGSTGRRREVQRIRGLRLLEEA